MELDIKWEHRQLKKVRVKVEYGQVINMNDEISAEEYSLMRDPISRITKWQRKNRAHVRARLRETVDDRVSRNAAIRKMKESSREKKCVKCGSRRNITINHKDGNAKNNALSNLEYKCKKCHGSHEGRYPKKLK